MIAALTVLLAAGCISENVPSSRVAYHSNTSFGNYTFVDGQDKIGTTVKRSNDPTHVIPIVEKPIDYGYTKDSARYTVTLTVGQRLHAYIDYTMDGYVVVVNPRGSLTRRELMDILDTFQRLE